MLLRTGKKPYGRQDVSVVCFEEGTGKNTSLPLQIFCAQRETLDFSPATLNLRILSADKPAAELLYLHEAASERFEIKSIETDLPGDFTYEISKRTNASKLMSYEAAISYLPAKEAVFPKDKRHNIRIHTTSSFTPVIVIPVNVFAESGIYAVPNVLSFGTAKAGEKYKQIFHVYHRDSKPFQVLNIVSSPNTACSYNKSASNSLAFEVEWSPQTEGIWEDVLTVRFSVDGAEQELSIKLIAFVH
jgi:hypothetical protein